MEDGWEEIICVVDKKYIDFYLCIMLLVLYFGIFRVFLKNMCLKV